MRERYDRYKYRYKEAQTDRQTDRQTERHTDSTFRVKWDGVNDMRTGVSFGRGSGGTGMGLW